jgi:hypothetical protein
LPIEHPDEVAKDRDASLDAGFAATFDESAAVLMGSGGHSVFNSLYQTVDLPRVVLRESDGQEPVVKPTSSEMPPKNSDSRYRLDGEIARGGMGERFSRAATTTWVVIWRSKCSSIRTKTSQR